MNFNFAEIIEGENVDDISLTIYYVRPLIFMHLFCIEDLIDGSEGRVVITGNELGKVMDIFKQLNSDILTPARGRSYDPLIRLYYVFESSVSGKLFDVAMWGGRGGIIFNGVEIEEHNVFYDIVIPFLPEDIVELLEIWIGRREWR